MNADQTTRPSFESRNYISELGGLWIKRARSTGKRIDFNSSSESEIERTNGNVFDSNPKIGIAYVSIEFEYIVSRHDCATKNCGTRKRGDAMISLNRRKRVFSTDDTTVSRCHTTSSQAFHKFFGGSSV